MDDRRNRYNTPKVVKNENLKIDVKFDITELNSLCAYIVSENTMIRRGNLINLRNLFAIMDMAAYTNEPDRLSRIEFVNRGLEARLLNNLNKSNLIMSYITGGFGASSSNIKLDEMSNSEIAYINNTVSEILKYSIIYNDIDEGFSILSRFKATDYIHRGKIVDEFEQWIVKVHNKFRRAKADNYEDMTFSLSGDEYIQAMQETYRQLASPANRLQFGVQALNMLTGGGVESGRVYTILGLPGEGKSSTLLDMAIQLKRYNKGYKCKDPTKRPCVVLLVMENSIKESVDRIFSMCVGQGLLDFNENEIYEALHTTGNLNLTDDDPIDIKIKFKPNLSVDTSYLYELVEDLEDEGYEVICVLQDYLKRIRSVDGSFGGDLRLQLGAVINEFKIFATLKNIPVITASQLNRTATSAIDEARIKNKADLVRLIGRSNVGESNLILENSDWIALIAPELDKNGQRYLGMQRVKSRYYIPGDFHYAYMPYIGNTIKLVEDYFSTIPVHKNTLSEKIALNGGVMSGIINEVKDFTEFNDVKLPQDANNIFLNASTTIGKSLNSFIYPYMYKEMCHVVRR